MKEQEWDIEGLKKHLEFNGDDKEFFKKAFKAMWEVATMKYVILSAENIIGIDPWRHCENFALKDWEKFMREGIPDRKDFKYE